MTWCGWRWKTGKLITCFTPDVWLTVVINKLLGKHEIVADGTIRENPSPRPSIPSISLSLSSLKEHQTITVAESQ